MGLAELPDGFDPVLHGLERATFRNRQVGAESSLNEVWDALVDRYAGRVWTVARGHGLGGEQASDACRLIWMRLADHVHELAPAEIEAWLEQVTKREAVRLQRLHRAGRRSSQP